jgi:hypothetical protein
MAAKGGFPWRWVIASLAIAVVVTTILVPPPGSDQDSDQVTDTLPAADTTSEVQQITQEDSPPSAPPDTVRVLVLNGTFVDGLAGRTQRLLLRSSTDTTVILAPFDPSDADAKPYAETIIISHVADLSSAAVIAGVLGIPDSNVIWEVPAGGLIPQVDVTVCLGQDISSEIPDN